MNVERATGWHSPRPDRPPALADVPAGKRVRVTRIIFEMVRSLCADLNLSSGDRIRVEERAAGTVTLRDAEGRSVSLPDHFAHFILVGEPEEGES